MSSHLFHVFLPHGFLGWWEMAKRWSSFDEGVVTEPLRGPASCGNTYLGIELCNLAFEKDYLCSIFMIQANACNIFSWLGKLLKPTLILGPTLLCRYCIEHLLSR